jgi:hypothetical protein
MEAADLQDRTRVDEKFAPVHQRPPPQVKAFHILKTHSLTYNTVLTIYIILLCRLKINPVKKLNVGLFSGLMQCNFVMVLIDFH